MEDISFADEATVLGKRRRSPSNLVPPLLSSLDDGARHADDALLSALPSAPTDSEPLAKKPHLPAKPPLPSVTDSPPPSARGPAISLDSLPCGVLQHIFSFVSPRSLQSLLHVSTLCRALLVPGCDLPRQHDRSKDLPLLPQDAIWKTARVRHFPTMPKPMAGQSEYNSFMLLLNRPCQFCGRLPSHAPSSHTPYKAGPGSGGVRIIWPFRIRSCSPCLKSRIKEDTEVFISNASPFRAGLPFVSLTPDMDYIPLHLLGDPTKPWDLVVEKYFYAPQIVEIQQQAEEARSYGQAAAENWIKDLVPRRQQVMKDCSRFEKWETPKQLDLLQRLQTDAQEKPNVDDQARPREGRLDRSITALAPPFDPVPEMPLRDFGPAPGQDHLHTIQDMDSRPSPAPRLSTPATHSSAHDRELARIRANRRDEILRRASELDPPIDSDTLMAMDAYDAAMQIARPLSDADWATLKTRLLKEQGKLDAEQDLRDSVTVAPIPGQFNVPEKPDQYVLTHLDQPIRDKLVDIADDFIRHRWNFGSLVAYPNAPQFAAEVLIHVRNAYVRLKQREDVMRLQQLTPSITTSTEDRMLRLEHMKYVFDKTIKPRTEQIRADLFFCSECAVGGSKLYAFDSVIQHYASKHTEAFSRGTQKVYWKAEWPDKPPFHPHPERAQTPAPTITHTPTLSHQPLQPGSASAPRNVPPSNMDWRSVHSMTTDTRSTTSHNTDNLSLSSNAPAAARTRKMLYDVQREMLAHALHVAWLSAARISRLPNSLQLFIALQEAHSAFAQKYTNDPSSSMLLDCVRHRSELQGMRSVSDLRCRECLLDPPSAYPPPYTLQNLLEHFQSVHVAKLRDGQKLHWWLDMVDLPTADVIREVQALPEVAPSLHKVLQEALLVSLAAPAPVEYPNPTADPGIHGHQIASEEQPKSSYAGWPLGTRVGTGYVAQVGPFPGSASQTLVDSMSAQRMQLDRSFDEQSVKSASSGVKGLPNRPPSSYDVRQDTRSHRSDAGLDPQAEFIPLSVTPTATQPRPTQMHPSEPETMERSNTAVRSTIHSTPAAVADNGTARFLDDFDTVVGGDQGSTKASTSVRPSRTGSMTGIAPDPSRERGEHTDRAINPDAEVAYTEGDHRRTTQRQAPYHELPPGRQHYAHEYVQRAPSRFVEYDDHGLPIQTQERRYYPISPELQTLPITYVDQYGRPIDVIPQREVNYREMASPERYAHHPYYSTRRAPVEYVRVQAYEDEPMVDRATGRYIVEEARPRSRYIELDTGFTEPRPAHQWRSAGRSLYRQVPETAAESREPTRAVRYSHGGERAYEGGAQGEEG